MKGSNKPQINHSFCIIIRFIFRKPVKIEFHKTLGSEGNAIFLEFSTIVAEDVRSLFPSSLNRVENKSVFGAFFDLKNHKLEKFSKSFNPKKLIKQIGELFLSLNVKPKNQKHFFEKFNQVLAKLTKILSKITENVNKNNGIHSTFPKSLNLDYSL